MICFTCRFYGHLQHDCPDKEVRFEDQQVNPQQIGPVAPRQPTRKGDKKYGPWIMVPRRDRNGTGQTRSPSGPRYPGNRYQILARLENGEHIGENSEAHLQNRAQASE